MPNRSLDLRVERSGFMRVVGVAASMAIVGMIVFTLWALRDILIPLTLAAFLSFVLAPLVGKLRKAKVPKAVAVPLVVLSAFAGLGLLGYVFVNQVSQLASQLPAYQTTLREKLADIRGTGTGAGALKGAVDVVQGLVRELNVEEPTPDAKAGAGAAAPGASSVVVAPAGSTVVAQPGSTVVAQQGASPAAPGAKAAGAVGPQKPVPVEVVDNKGPIEALAALISPLMHPLATTAMIVIFVAFILAQREDLRNRFVKLVGGRDIPRTTAAIDDAVKRLSRLFAMQLLLNSVFGAFIGVGLWLIGIPNALLWGVLATVMRFVPYVGAIVSAALPLVMAVSVDPGWTKAIMVALLFLVSEPIVGHVLEPLLLGRSTGLSPVAVVVAATFWTWLWGPIGLILATPLTVCLVVLGKHIEGLRFLDTLLGDKPALTQAEVFYQRMLVGDSVETAAQIENFASKGGLLDYYDEVAIAGLRLAQHDLDRSMLDTSRVRRVRASVQELFDGLDDELEAEAKSTAESEGEAGAPRSRTEIVAAIAAEGESAPAKTGEKGEAKKEESERGRGLVRLNREDLDDSWRGETPVVVIGGRTALDEAAAIPLADALTRSGLNAINLPAETLRGAGMTRMPSEGVKMIILSFLDGSSETAMRFAARRLRVKAPHARIVLGVWDDPDETVDRERLKQTTQVDFVATSAREAHQYATLTAVTGIDLDDLDSALDKFEIAPAPSKSAAKAV